MRQGLADERLAPLCILIRRVRLAPTEVKNPGGRLAFLGDGEELVKNFLK